MPAADTVLQGRYRIVRQLGKGGMGAVYEAVDERLSRTVALKETLAETDELKRAFEREARLLANLRQTPSGYRCRCYRGPYSQLLPLPHYSRLA